MRKPVHAHTRTPTHTRTHLYTRTLTCTDLGAILDGLELQQLGFVCRVLALTVFDSGEVCVLREER